MTVRGKIAISGSTGRQALGKVHMKDIVKCPATGKVKDRRRHSGVSGDSSTRLYIIPCSYM